MKRNYNGKLTRKICCKTDYYNWLSIGNHTIFKAEEDDRYIILKVLFIEIYKGASLSQKIEEIINKLPRGRAIEVLNGVCYANIVISVRHRRDGELNHIFSSAESSFGEERGLKNLTYKEN